MATVLGADLHFCLERPGRPDVEGHLSGQRSRLVLHVDDPAAFAGAGDVAAVKALAEGLAGRGVQIRVVHGDQHLVTLGAVNAPWWQRRATGSRRIRLGSLRGALTSARARARSAEPVLPDASLLPPTTMWPPMPTFGRGRRRHVTTTHDPDRGGSARLVVAKEALWGGERVPVFWLADGITVGSAPGCDIVLPGLEPVHASIHHDDADEWVVTAVAGTTRVHGVPVRSQLLRTGSRVDFGPHSLVFRRDEYADHGRPHGGRVGGELGRQLPQPPRTSRSSRTGPAGPTTPTTPPPTGGS